MCRLRGEAEYSVLSTEYPVPGMERRYAATRVFEGSAGPASAPLEDSGRGGTGFLNELREQPRHHLRLHQLARLVEVVVDQRVRVDAEAVVDRRQHLAGVDRVLARPGGGAVRLAVDVAPLDAG